MRRARWRRKRTVGRTTPTIVPMRRARWRTRRMVKHTIRVIVLIVIALGAFVMLPPSSSRDVERAVRGHLDTVEETLESVAGRAAGWLAEGERAVRDAIGAERSGTTVSGPARVVDGDTLVVRGTRVRLHGVDAPESKQTCIAGGQRWRCGREATRALVRRIGGRPVACEERDRDGYGRAVAVCRVGGKDVNAWMAAEGWAFAYRKYSQRYVAEEAAAKAAGRGIWRGEVVAPWDWRKGERLSAAAPAAGTGECRIKGNISRSGTRIYHVPGGQFYARTRIDTSKGERWFCSEAEARAAGWRRATR